VCLVLDILPVFVNIRRRFCHIGLAKKLSSKLCSHLHQILMDFTIFSSQRYIFQVTTLNTYQRIYNIYRHLHCLIENTHGETFWCKQYNSKQITCISSRTKVQSTFQHHFTLCITKYTQNFMQTITSTEKR